MKSIPISILFFILLMAISCHVLNLPDSYYHDDGYFAFAKGNDNSKARAITEKSKYGYKTETIQKVMDDLIEAKGMRSMIAPTLLVNNATRKVAFARPSDAIVGMEEKAYDICASFGKDSLNAIAALMAHELTHYYEKHDWKNQFEKDFGASNMTKFDETEKLDIETQADYFGGFLAYQAGYNTLGIMPQFLEEVYRQYNFEEKLPGYPSLTERKNMAKKSEEKLIDLIHVFETANYLVALGEYENAKKYYEYIVVKEKYQSREMYNNLGVTAIHLALEFFPDGALKYIYPIELDINTRLGNGTKGMGDDLKKARDILINEAIMHFKNAQNLDQNYAPALLNLGCAYALQDNFFEADYHARKAIQIGKKQNNNKLISDAQVLLGIIQAQQNETAEATASFQQAIKANNRLGTLNFNILQGVDNASPASTRDGSANIEQIENISLDKLVSQLNIGGLDVKKDFEINKKTKLALLQNPSSKVLINFMPFDDAYHFFHIADASYNGKTSKGIQINDPVDKITANENYGTPNRIVNTSNGLYLVYQGYRLIFEINKENRVKNWVVFREQQKMTN